MKGGDSEAGGTLLRLAVLRAWAELYIACESGWLDAELERHARKLAASDKALVPIGMPNTQYNGKDFLLALSQFYALFCLYCTLL